MFRDIGTRQLQVRDQKVLRGCATLMLENFKEIRKDKWGASRITVKQKWLL